jgi:hypothetical protein
VTLIELGDATADLSRSSNTSWTLACWSVPTRTRTPVRNEFTWSSSSSGEASSLKQSEALRRQPRLFDQYLAQLYPVDDYPSIPLLEAAEHAGVDVGLACWPFWSRR